jgi:hypothetical protein
MPTERPFNVLNGLGRTIVTISYLEPDRYRVDVCPDHRPEAQDNAATVPRTTGEELEFTVENAEGGEASAQELACGPNYICSLPPNVPLTVDITDEAMQAWQVPSELEDYCVVNAQGFGHMVRGRVVRVNDDDFPTLLLERDDRRTFRLRNSLPVTVDVTVILRRYRLSLEIASVQSAPASMLNFQNLGADEDEPCSGQPSWRVEVVESQGPVSGEAMSFTLRMKPRGYFTLGVDEGDLPTWLEPGDLEKVVDIAADIDGMECRADIIIDSTGESWPLMDIVRMPGCLN